MRITKICFIFLITFISLVHSSFSPNFTYYIDQPDGYSFKARMFGSEFYNYIQTENGYTIIGKTVDGDTYWYYAKEDNGNLVSSDILVSENSKPPFYSYQIKPKEKRSTSNKSSFSPLSNTIVSNRDNTVNPLVLLIDFSTSFLDR